MRETIASFIAHELSDVSVNCSFIAVNLITKIYYSQNIFLPYCNILFLVENGKCIRSGMSFATCEIMELEMCMFT